MSAELSMTRPSDGEESLFLAALERSEPERSAFLDTACQGNPALRSRLETLLAAHARPDANLELPDEVSRHQREAFEGWWRCSGVGLQVGPYKLLEKIGEGGCGIVYVAEQLEPVRRQVAVKVIKLGMDTKELVARFAAERQALALMDHPNIARVFDAGTTGTVRPSDSTSPIPEGRPYFVMELVRGAWITNYCDEHQLGIRQRLDLFVRVCLAIQHAHQKGIIHRDIKPSNILVTVHDEIPVPKVIDFGIAKAIQGRLTESTVHTQQHQFMGTPAYMSPEQAEMGKLDVDTRSDIYSLGVLLYELLTGRTPVEGNELRGMGVDALRQAIREREPSTPSSKLASLSAAEQTETARRRSGDSIQLIQLLRGDLDWILMKCLEKDRSRRYATATELVADIQRHLDNEPVFARPPSAAYRLQKAFRRHRVAFSAVGAVGLALLIGLAGSISQAVRATRAEALASNRLAESEAVTTFLTEVFQSSDPARDGRTVTVVETLKAAAQRLDSDLTDQDARRAELRWILGKSYLALNLAAEAIPLLNQVASYRVSALGPDSREALEAKRQVGKAYTTALEVEQALGVQKELLASHQRLHGRSAPETIAAMVDLGFTYCVANRMDKARELGTEAVKLSREINGPEHPDTVLALQTLGLAYPDAEAVGLREEGYALSLKANGPEHKVTLRAALMLDLSYAAVGREEPRLKLLEWLVPMSVKLSGPNNRATLRNLSELEKVYYNAGRWQDALQLKADHARWDPKDLDTELLVMQAWFGREADYHASCHRLLKLVEGTQIPTTAERAAKAVLLLPPEDPQVLATAFLLARRAVEHGADHRWFGQFQLALGMAEFRRGNYAAADRALLAAEKAAPINAGFFHAMSLQRQGREAEARRRFDETAVRMAPLPDDDQNPLANGSSGGRITTWLAFREAARVLGLEAGEALTSAWLEKLSSDVSATPADGLRSLQLATLLLWLGKTEEHERLSRSFLASASQSVDASVCDRAAKTYLLRPDPDPHSLKQASAAARRALEIASGQDSNLPWFRTVAGMAAYREGQFDRAEALLTEAVVNPLHPSQGRLALVFRAMTRWCAGHTNDAKADLAELRPEDFALPDRSRFTSAVRDHDQLAIRLACYEAATLMKVSPAPRKPD
ncbi:MAG: serine/threonine protein kinase [Verrucomicrobiales bacterium]|nr:serine/threonine protein kinase [Verrucomicrobiales bacterium]